MSTYAAPSLEQSALALAWVAILILAFAMSGLMRQLHALSNAIHGGRSLTAGPSAGMDAPSIPQLNGAGRSVLLFADQRCPSCAEAMEALAAAARVKVDDSAYAVVYRGAAPSLDRPDLITIADGSRLFTALNIVVTPTVVVLDDRRKVVAAAPVGSRDALEDLIPYISQGMIRNEHSA